MPKIVTNATWKIMAVCHHSKRHYLQRQNKDGSPRGSVIISNDIGSMKVGDVMKTLDLDLSRVMRKKLVAICSETGYYYFQLSKADGTTYGPVLILNMFKDMKPNDTFVSLSTTFDSDSIEDELFPKHKPTAVVQPTIQTAKETKESGRKLIMEPPIAAAPMSEASAATALQSIMAGNKGKNKAATPYHKRSTTEMHDCVVILDDA
jgi:hypothetical protein